MAPRVSFEAAPSAGAGSCLRIAVLNRVFSPTGGGAERYSIALVEQLASRHEMHIFAQQINHQWPGVTYHTVSSPLTRPRWINQLWYATATWWATRRGFDVVHSHENTWHGQVQTVHVKSVQRSLLGASRGMSRVGRQIKIALSLRLTTYLYLERSRLRHQPAHEVVAVSQPLANEICQEYPDLQSVLSVITPGVDIPVQIAMKKEARSAISTRADGQIILFVANDYARKGLATLLRALHGLPADVRLLVVGGTVSQTIQFGAKAKLMGVGERVQFLGPLLDMYPAYCAADVLAHPTLEDSFGMVVLEAMAHGLPVVVSGPQHCGISALLHDQHDALLLDDPQSVPALRNALRVLLSDRSLMNAITTNAMHFAQRHTWTQAAAAYEILYHRLVATEKTRQSR